MARTRLLLQPGIVMDARRALWFEEQETLAVADLHLGYLWAQRARGALFPLEAVDDAAARLAVLVAEYRPREVLVLGDVVHRALHLGPVQQELTALFAALGEHHTTVRLLGGNHDRGLERLLPEWGLPVCLEPEAQVGPHLLLHGDAPPSTWPVEGRVFMGHEHPAVHVGDRVTSVKCPAFLVSPQLVVLPAFSQWAAGSNVRAGTYLSPMAQNAVFSHAVAILANKLLPVPMR